jgi:hypothetical protein
MFLRINETVRTLHLEYPEVFIPSFALIQKGKNTFHFYVDCQNMQACDTFASHVTTLVGNDICMSDEHGWVPKVQLKGPWSRGNGASGDMVVDAPMKEHYIIMGLETRHTINDVKHALQTVDTNMPPNIEISAPRGTNIHPTVFRLNGGKGGTCLQVPSGTRDVAKKFDALINRMKYVKYGQSRIFFFTHDYATSGGEQPTASSSSAPLTDNPQVSALTTRLRAGTLHSHIISHHGDVSN